MPQRASIRSASYNATRSYIASEWGRAGLDRLGALGASWRPRAKPHAIVDGLENMPGAPPPPKLPTFRDKAAFLCGAIWAIGLVSNLARHMEQKR